ncbi:rhamnan synthesis F family protein [Nitrospirillum sp. BR 11164]|uniref:rhamnan synthesis F family protein n=1 Tax=Nitrospirillum sp. BR 11164 TaxID=3104324 RepID=UPI002AFE212F|nr:rhamnan synthesis F family protein [Nitrospirillum sp. BR 11164]MEA1647900.1 rhamnan synthesis F family protein [Nitrospirillum sp. BR 11164]
MSDAILKKLKKGLQLPMRLVDYVDLARCSVEDVLPRRPTVKASLPGQIPLEGARKIAVFNHYDPRGIVHDYVVYFIAKLAEAGYAIIFASNCPKLSAAETEKVLPHVAWVLKRRNIGWDFGAFKDGIALINDLGALDHLLITNDSIYGPLQDINEVVERTDPAIADVWGLTDSWDRHFHLQSYFVVFHQAVLRSPSFAKFWRRVRYYRSKRWVIRDYEIGLTRFFLRAGFRCHALHSYRDVVAELSGPLNELMKAKKTEAGSNAGHFHDLVLPYLRHTQAAISHGMPLNQTHYFWDHLVARKAYPFIKRDLLQRNPVGIPYVHRWEEVIRLSSSYDTNLILHHLQMSMRNRVH